MSSPDVVVLLLQSHLVTCFLSQGVTPGIKGLSCRGSWVNILRDDASAESVRDHESWWQAVSEGWDYCRVSPQLFVKHMKENWSWYLISHDGDDLNSVFRWN